MQSASYDMAGIAMPADRVFYVERSMPDSRPLGTLTEISAVHPVFDYSWPGALAASTILLSLLLAQVLEICLAGCVALRTLHAYCFAALRKDTQSSDVDLVVQHVVL